MERSLQHELILPAPGRWIREAAPATEAEGTKLSFKLLILFLLILYSNIAIAIPIAAMLAFKSRWFGRVVLAAVMGTYLLAIFFTYSRGSMLGLAAVFGLVSWKQKSPVLRIMMVVGLAGALMFGSVYWQRTQ